MMTLAKVSASCSLAGSDRTVTDKIIEKHVACQLLYLSLVALAEPVTPGIGSSVLVRDFECLMGRFVARRPTAVTSSDSQLAALLANVRQKTGTRRSESLARILGRNLRFSRATD